MARSLHFILFALIGITSAVGQEDGECLPPFEFIGDGCYYLQKDVRETWHDSQLICEILGGKLAEFESQSEIAFMDFALNLDDPNCETWNGNVWIGGRELGTSNIFVWDSTGEEIVHDNWNKQPNSSATDNIIALDCEISYQWIEEIRSTENPFICEATSYSGTTEDPSSSTVEESTTEEITTTTASYEECEDPFFYIGAGCYYISDLTDNFYQAKESCEEMGSKLVEMEEKEELDRITNYLASNEDVPNFIFMGGQYNSNVSDFVWISTNEVIFYTNWASSEPTSGPNYVINFNGNTNLWKWYDDPPTDDFRNFMCEKEGAFSPSTPSTTTENPLLKCEFPYSIYDSKWCYYFPPKDDYNEFDRVKQKCEEMTPRGKLIELETQEELDFITDFFLTNGASYSSTCYLGVSEIGSTSEFVWLTSNMTVEYFNWYDSYPRPGEDEGDIIYIYGFHNYQMLEAQGDSLRGYVCELDDRYI